MISNPLIAFSNTYNFQIENDYAFGIIEGYMVTVYNSGTKKTAFISCCFPTDSTPEENKINSYAFSAEINKIIDDGYLALKNYEITCDSVSFTTVEELKNFDKAVKKLIELLIHFNIPGCEVCIDCGRPIGDSPKCVVESQNAHVMCKDCADAYVEEISSSDAVKNKSKSRVKGTCCSVIGSLLGLIIALFAYIVFVPANDILGLNPLILNLPFAAITTILSFLFYRIFTGNKSLERILPCLITSALFTVINVYFSTAIIYAKTFGVSSFNSASGVMGIILKSPVNNPYFKSDALSHLFYSVVIVIIVVLIYSIIFEEKKVAPLKVFPMNSGNIESTDYTEPKEEI